MNPAWKLRELAGVHQGNELVGDRPGPPRPADWQRPRSGTQRAENHSVGRFTLSNDDARQATIDVLVYNLHTGSAGAGMVKKRKPPK